MEDLSQWLDCQKAWGVKDVVTDPPAQKAISLWGTKDWQQHRFMGQGPDDARIMIVDGRGSFFQGKPGRLLVKILKAMTLAPDEVYICNAADLEEIRTRVNRMQLRAVITLGPEAAECIFGSGESLNTIRGKFQVFEGVQAMPTLHPEQLLEDQALKRPVWEDLQAVMRLAGLGHGG